MTAQDIKNQLLSSEFKQLSEEAFTDINILSYINLGLIELYKRFKLGVKVEVLKTNPEVKVYTLRSEDLNKILDIYDSKGRVLKDKRFIDYEEENYDVTVLSYDTIMLTNPIESEIVVTYKASPASILQLTSRLPIPDDMVEALLYYIGYRAHSSIENEQEANMFFVRFEASCERLKELGHENTQIPIGPSTIDQGFA